MKGKHLCLLLVAVIASATVTVAQSEDELPIPVENNNQFPPEDQPESDDNIIQGSGNGAIVEPEDPIASTTELNPPIEEVQSNTQISEVEISPSEETLCPESCLCSFEGSDFVTDCSGLGFKDLPKSIDIKTTKLKIQNNQLTEIPKDISLLKNVNFLNASNNSIMDLASGSISEMPELTRLDLSNNRLIEYPKDLKNAFGLTKLTDLVLGGNDMRTSLDPETLSKFTSLQKLTLPSTLTDLQTKEDLCKSLNNMLTTICIENCEAKSYDCSNASDDSDMNMLDAALPGTIFSENNEDNSDPNINATNEDKNDNSDNSDPNINTVNEDEEKSDISESVDTPKDSRIAPTGNILDNDDNTTSNKKDSSTSEFSLRSAVIKDPIAVSSQNSIIDATQDTSLKKESNNPNISATTAGNNTGGVNKSVIGLIVAGMVLVIAGITIKKNWNSIKKRFSSNSNSRTPNEHPTGNANGTAPEEVPLQDKSPV